MNLRIITSHDTINGFKYFIKCNIFEFGKNTENVKGLICQPLFTFSVFYTNFQKSIFDANYCAVLCCVFYNCSSMDPSVGTIKG
jgi:hypothetical protein